MTFGWVVFACVVSLFCGAAFGAWLVNHDWVASIRSVAGKDQPLVCCDKDNRPLYVCSRSPAQCPVIAEKDGEPSEKSS